MGWFRKGLLLLPCVASSDVERSRPTESCVATYPWHQQPDVVSLVLACLPAADVLAAERVCKAWRQCRIPLRADVNIVVSKKTCKWQQAWLRHNVDRVAGRLCVSLGTTGGGTDEGTRNSKATAARCQSTSKYANELVLNALRASHANNLELHNCSSIITLPADSFSALQQLQQLHLSGCSHLAALPESLGSLSSLQQLSVESCDHLTALPNSTGQLKALQRLAVQNCPQLQLIPSSLGQLCSLEEITLHGCMQLQQLPESLGHLGSLRLLDVQQCALKLVPSSVGQLRLEVLKLVSCPYLQELPDSCSQLHQLQDLHLEVPLNHLPSVSHLTSLKRLFIGHVTKEITSLTHQIGHLAELESLSLLGWPGLQQLPEGLGDLASLTQLVLRECGQLMALPGCLGRLRSLKRLVLQGCGLIALPQSLGNLESLTSLIIHSCDIRDLPSSIGQLTALQQFILADCPGLRHIPGSFGQLGHNQQQSQSLNQQALSNSNSIISTAAEEADCSSSSSSSSFTVTISGCERLQMPISMAHMRRHITPGHLAAAVAEKALQASWQLPI